MDDLNDKKSIFVIYVQNPAEIGSRRATKAILHVRLNRDYNEILSDNSKPRSELIDDAITGMKLGEPFPEENGANKVFMSIECNCARCGGGLSIYNCPECGIEFDGGHLRSGWDVPLSVKMVAYLEEHGFKFVIDPILARQHEKSRYEYSMRRLAARKGNL